MQRDHHVKFCPEEEIARLALVWRQAGGINNLGNFNIVGFVQKVVSTRFSK